MEQLPASITITVAVLTVFLMFATALRYVVRDNFKRTRLIMTSFFFFIVATLTISFWEYALATLPYSIPAALVGALVGRFVGVRAAEERLRAEGFVHYMEHFAHVHIGELQKLTWWSLINYYTVAGSLLLINFVGLSTVIFDEAKSWATLTSALGAFLLGTIAPYLVHLWTIKTAHHASSTTSER